jgi:cell division protein FtsB
MQACSFFVQYGIFRYDWYRSCTITDMKSALDHIKASRLADRRLLLIVVLIILVFLMMDFNNRMTTMLRLDKQEKALQTKVVELQKTRTALEAKMEYAQSDKALEEWARENAHQVAPGDEPLVLIPGPTYTPAPITSESPTAIPLQTWEIWKELFFGFQ